MRGRYNAIMKEQDENTRVTAIEQIYEDRLKAQLDNDVEISILRSCGYRIPADKEKLDILAGRLLDFLNSILFPKSKLIKELDFIEKKLLVILI